MVRSIHPPNESIGCWALTLALSATRLYTLLVPSCCVSVTRCHVPGSQLPSPCSKLSKNG